MSNNTTLNEAERNFLKLFSTYNRPITIREISDELDLPSMITKDILDSLLEKGNIVAFSSERGKYQYYASVSSKEGINALFAQKYADIAGGLESQYKEVKEENEKLKKQIDALYANILTLMGIFIAIFALIVINIEAIGNFVSKIQSSDELYWALLKINIPLLVSLVVLILLIKWLLLPKSSKK